MIHLSLIDYKRLYEDLCSKYEVLASDNVKKNIDIEFLKKSHNEQVEIIEGTKRQMKDAEEFRNERELRLMYLTGGNGDLESRIMGVIDKVRCLTTEKEMLESSLMLANEKIESLTNENLSVKAEHPENDYRRLEEDYNRLLESYKNLERCIKGYTE